MSQGLLALLAPRHPRVFRDQHHAPNTGGPAISWLEALKNLGAETTQEKEIDTDAPSSFSAVLSESLTQQSDKIAKRGTRGFCHFCYSLTLGTQKIMPLGKGAERRLGP